MGLTTTLELTSKGIVDKLNPFIYDQKPWYLKWHLVGWVVSDPFTENGQIAFTVEDEKLKVV